MFDHECVPFAPSLIESMRSLGYSFSSAIADLLDNSISAGAKNIDIISEPGANPWLVILDDGCGMSENELYEAMRYGSTNPLKQRSENDLGRFGLGLKSASLSQCRKLVVISKKRGRISAYSWDLDYVIEKGQWMLKGFTEDELSSYPEINRLHKLSHGTYIFLGEFDRIKASTGDFSETFIKHLDDMEDHLSLVFHRFIEDGLKIRVNKSLVKARDPFLSDHPATQRKKEERIIINGEKIILKPFILPHISKLSRKDIEKLGGKDNLKNEQGFYIYRNKRLIIWGTWFRIERKAELNKLARVRVDIAYSLGCMWSIDITKSTATLPDIIKKNMYSAVYDSVLSSETVHTYRGRSTKKKTDIEYVWERIQVRDGCEYVINRTIPQLKLLEDTLDNNQLKMLDSVIKTLEESFPVAALYVDAAKGNVEDHKTAEEQTDVEEIWKDLQIQMDYVKANNLPVLDYYRAFQKVEPYCNYPEIKERIQKEIDLYE